MKRIAGLVALVTFGFSLGCSSLREVPVSETESAEKVAAVIYPSGEIVEFDKDGGIINTYKGTIDGITKEGTIVSIPLDDVLHVRVRRTNAAKSALGAVIVVGVIVGIYALFVAIFVDDFGTLGGP